MSQQNKKTSFVTYPFIGAYNLFKWFVIGVGTLGFSLFKPSKTSNKELINKSNELLVDNNIKNSQSMNDIINKNTTSEIKNNIVNKPDNSPKKTDVADKIDNSKQKDKIATINNILQSKKDVKETINQPKEPVNNSLDIAAKEKNKRIKDIQAMRKNEYNKAKNNQAQLRKVGKKLTVEKEKLMQELASGELKRTDKPVAFRYKAVDPKGKMVTGTFTGSSKLDVNAFLVNEGYEVYSIETSDWINFLYGQSDIGLGKLGKKDLVFWLTQLHTYVKAGIPLTDAVKILSNQMGRKKGLRKTFEKVIYELTMGTAFSDALAKQGTAFPSLLINMLKAAEATGELEETLKDMAEYYNELEKTRKQMISAMTYPGIITMFSLGVISFILLYVIPKFTDVYDQAGIEINGFTKSIIYLSNFLKNNMSIILLILACSIIILIFLFKRVKFFRKNVQTLLMHIPVVKNVIIYKEMTIFAKTFSSLLKNNVFITDSIEILSKVTNNEIYKEIMYNTISNIAKGERISESFKDQWAVPDVAYYMIVTGESTGELAAMMENVSNYYQDQHRNIVNGLKSFIEPIMISSLAIIVGAILMAVIIPMFNLYSSISM